MLNWFLIFFAGVGSAYCFGGFLILAWAIRLKQIKKFHDALVIFLLWPAAMVVLIALEMMDVK